MWRWKERNQHRSKQVNPYVFPADAAHLARNEGSVAAKALVVHSRSAKDKPLVVVVSR